MQQRVTAILVVRSGVDYLGRTLAGISQQTRKPDAVIAVDLESEDGSRDRLASTDLDQLIGAPAKTSFGEGVARGAEASHTASENEWLWLLAHDNAPEPAALEHLLGAVEIAPSVAIAGPKLMRWQRSDVIAEFGESVTRFGASVGLVAGELDQAQHDVQNDVLAVAAGGMLVRRTLWNQLDGFDPGLPSIDAALDFSVRARLAGHRVVVVPGARVASAGGPQHFGLRSVSERRRARIARSAQLHRRLVYAPIWALPLQWLSLVPLAIVRSLLHLLAKQPGSIGAEFRAAFAVAFGATGVLRARARLRQTRRVGWAAIAPLRLTRRQAREQLAAPPDTRPILAGPVDYVEEPIGFISGGGLWAVVAAAVVGLIAFAALVGRSSVTGGGLLPLSADVGALWSHVGWGWREVGVGFTGAADPFAVVLALLGTVTFWDPSYSIVLLYLLALPLATLGAWFCARRFAERRWLPAVAAVLWGIAPPLLGSLDTGHLSAAIAHILLPWLVVATMNAMRSWSAAAAAAIVFAGVAASAPVIVPALLVLWVALMLARPTRLHRLIGIPIPAAVLFAPLVIDQLARGNPLGLLADPGAPVAGRLGEVADSGVQLALGSASGGSNGWTALLEENSLPGAAGPFVVAVLLLPLGVLALTSLFVRGTRRAIPCLVLALLGFATAVVASRLELTASGAEAVTVWPGSGLSLFWLGLVGASLVTLDALRRGSVPAGVLLGVASVLVAIPLIAASALETRGIQPGADRILPAVVEAEAETEPDVGTLIFHPVGDAVIAELQRGRGATLDDQSTLDTTATGFSAADERLATLAGNLASRSGFDFAPELDALGVEFIVLEDTGSADVSPVVVRTQEALDGNALLVPVGETMNGLLWRYEASAGGASSAGPADTGSAYGVIVLLTQGLVFLIALLLAVPTTRRRRQYTQRAAVAEKPASTFDEDDDD